MAYLDDMPLDKKPTAGDLQACEASIMAASCQEPHQELRRNISSLEMLSLGFNICNSWIAISTALAIAISAGGTVTVLFGIIVTSVAYLAVAITLAELASVYPTSGGQYHFTSILCPHKMNQLVSYICGLAATSSWVFLAAAITTLSSQLLLAVPAYYVKPYSPKSWHYALVFQALNLLLLLYNIFVLVKARWTHNIGCKFLSSAIYQSVLI